MIVRLSLERCRVAFAGRLQAPATALLPRTQSRRERQHGRVGGPEQERLAAAIFSPRSTRVEGGLQEVFRIYSIVFPLNRVSLRIVVTFGSNFCSHLL